jgi:hypothetical protein
MEWGARGADEFFPYWLLAFLLMSIKLSFFVFFFKIGPCYIAQTGLELMILLPLSPKCCDYRHGAPRQARAKFFFSLFFWRYWCLNSGLHICSAGTVSLAPLHQYFFGWVFFKMGVLETVCLGWLLTLILLISASWVRLQAWDTGVQFILIC